MIPIPMKASPWLWTFLKSYEKFRPTAYKPTPKDVWTCGYGHTAGVTASTTATTDQANVWLVQDGQVATGAVNRLVNRKLTQNQFDALCSLCFNIGVANFSGSGLLKYVNAGNDHAAAADFDNWDKQAGDVLTGLLRRREAESAHYLTPDAPALIA